MSDENRDDPLAGIGPEVSRTMARLLRMRPEPQKDAARPDTPRAAAQRRRRERERQREQERRSLGEVPHDA